MPWFRRRPGQPVEAEQFFASVQPWPKGVFRRSASKVAFGAEWTSEESEFYVITIHGQETKIVDGDWILPEPDSIHFYPVKADIFAERFEAVEA